LQAKEWTIDGEAKNAIIERLGDFDALLVCPEKPIAVALNKLYQ
jgi:hypothetical protein